jgi:hypothetical protein
MHLILAAGAVAILVTFWIAHRARNTFNLLDLLMKDGRVCRVAVAFMLVLAVSTWVIIDLQINGKLTEGYFTIYTGAWIIPLVARLVSNKDASTSLTMTTVTQETTEKATP